MSELQEWVSWFRKTSPYINALRHQLVVIALSGEALKDKNFSNIIHDISILHSLGIRLVLVFGARPQIDEALLKQNIDCVFHDNLRITKPEYMPSILAAYGALRSELEAKLSMGVINSPMQGAKINVVSGNFVMAKPHGVIQGVDFGLTGQVRKIDVASIHHHLQSHSVVLIPATGYSVSGDVFSLAYEELAGELAAQISADKIIFFGSDSDLMKQQGKLIKQVTVKNINNLVDQASNEYSACLLSQLLSSAKACEKGVKRAHILNYMHNGALLEELFTRDGSGTMVSVDNYDQIRPARLEDTNGILELIRPLEEQGYLVRRSRELLETELDYYFVEVRDNAIIACVGLYPFPEEQSGELSCFAVDAEYRNCGRGDRLLDVVSERARNQNLKKLFVLTTKTEHWFKERGFELTSEQNLPGDRNYNKSRNAKVLVKELY